MQEVQYQLQNPLLDGFIEDYFECADGASGFSVVVVLSIVKFPILTGGSQALSNILLVVVYGVFAVGVATAIGLRRWRPEVYQRIGRQ